MNIICCTGHRPKGFPWVYGLSERHDKYISKLIATIESAIVNDGVTEFYTGMAMGADLDFAEAVLTLRNTKYSQICLSCIIPCKNQCFRWNKESVERYNSVLKQADHSTILSEKYTPECMLARNRYMVDRSDKVIAIWNGKEIGGTWYTINYARKKNKPIEYIMLNSIE